MKVQVKMWDDYGAVFATVIEAPSASQALLLGMSKASGKYNITRIEAKRVRELRFRTANIEQWTDVGP